MNCLKCEIERAKLRTVCLLIVGWPLQRIADHLSQCYGETYFVADNALYRLSKLPPYKPHLIRSAENEP